MPGVSNSDNLFGLSPFIVDPVAGSGSYTTIQSAIDACALVGGGIVYIRNGSYAENLSWTSFVSLEGVNVDGRLISGSQVIITGNVTIGTSGTRLATNIAFTSAVGDTFTINPLVGGASLYLKSCTVNAPAGIAINSVPAVGAVGSVFIVGSNLGANGTVISASEGGTVNISANSQLLTVTSSCVSATDTVSVICTNSQFGAQAGHDILFDSSGVCNVTFCVMTSGLEAVNIVSGTLNLIDCKIGSAAASGFFATGAGTLSYSGISNIDVAIDIDPTLTQVVFDQKPYADTSGTIGSATFDPAIFTVTSGSVSLNGIFTGSATTVGAVTADLVTIPLGATPGTITISSLTAGFDSALANGVSYTAAAGARTDGVTATQIGVAAITTREDAALAAAALTVVVSGNDLIVRVLGVAAQTINWTATVFSTFAT